MRRLLQAVEMRELDQAASIQITATHFAAAADPPCTAGSSTLTVHVQERSQAGHAAAPGGGSQGARSEGGGGQGKPLRPQGAQVGTCWLVGPASVLSPAVLSCCHGEVQV